MKNLTLLSSLLLLLTYATQAKSQTNNNSKIIYINDTTLNFNKLINKFSGKIIYVDIWASWCGPCKQELRMAKDIKGFRQFAAKNNIVILYICMDDNNKLWKNFISFNKLEGYHILKNPQIYKDFHTTFSSVQMRQGKLKRSFYIPRHMIIDKNGIVADSTATYQGSTKVYSKLTEMLNPANSK
ncbi:TlpA family protein disulfide reductase [Mucilaginibacter kameinonensis]|uniref:TlpA family protein disulfide reductase n=1 Tax=Mucilaginibacter kameinonensis TaxID=452286 RepID=UPI000EF7ECF2|nr:TlpA disulfide reductase family protein [Mucilaginibacter kameinonensis]